MYCAVFTYFVMMGVFSLFTTYREKRIFMVALEKDKAGLVSSYMCIPVLIFNSIFSF